MELLLGIVVVAGIIVVSSKLLHEGSQRQYARVAATLAAADYVVEKWEHQNAGGDAPMDANLLINSHLATSDPKVLGLAHKEFDRLLVEEPEYVASQARVQVAIRDHVRMMNGE